MSSVSRRALRALLTAVGLVAVGWSAWWLQHQLEWWAVGALYILLGCLSWPALARVTRTKAMHVSAKKPV